jgi:2-amino-4-hydroxy-6-hydroxymethyldihydropteridine diphosphokinase
MKSSIVFIALGSNLQNPLQQVTTALERLKQLPHSVVNKNSSLYLSSPLGPANQPDFINCVSMITTQLTPEQLLDHLQVIENEQGRVRTLKWGPRTLDLDILLFDTLILQTSRLSIPHPGLKERAFFIYPLCEIAPHWVMPDGKTVADLKNKLDLTTGLIRQLTIGENPYAENGYISGQL